MNDRLDYGTILRMFSSFLSPSWVAFPGVPSFGILSGEMETLKRHLSQIDSPIVLCHNDLLIKNIIYNHTDGEEEQWNTLWRRPTWEWSAVNDFMRDECQNSQELLKETFDNQHKLVNFMLIGVALATTVNTSHFPFCRDGEIHWLRVCGLQLPGLRYWQSLQRICRWAFRNHDGTKEANQWLLFFCTCNVQNVYDSNLQHSAMPQSHIPLNANEIEQKLSIFTLVKELFQTHVYCVQTKAMVGRLKGSKSLTQLYNRSRVLRYHWRRILFTGHEGS